jgi:DNA polymerase-3 subunit delta'
MAFEGVFGQERVKQILKSSLKRNRLAHAYLFHGLPGVGKDAVSIDMAMGLNCKESVVGGCGKCSSCLSIQNLEHPGFRLVLPVPTRPKSMKEEKYEEILRDRALQRVKNPYRDVSYSPEMSILPIIGINQVRTMKREVVLRVAGGGWRVFLVSHVEQMTISAANSLLKLLEEPPRRTILFLTTCAPGRLLKTIISRCHTIRFDPLLEKEIEDALVQRWSVKREKARFIAGMAGGSLQRGLELAEEGFEEQRKVAFAFLESSLVENRLRQVEEVEHFIKRTDKLKVIEILRILQLWLRDLIYLSLGFQKKVMNSDRMDLLVNFSKKWPGFDAEKGMKSVERSIDFIEKNVYLPLIVVSLSQELSKCKHT